MKMKKIRISAVLMAFCISAGMLMAGCKKTTVSGTASSATGTSSDTGVSISLDTSASDSASDPSDSSGSPSNYVTMTYEDNYDQAAIDEMGKVVNIHGMQFTALDYNFYFANEYNQLIMMNYQGYASLPMTGAGFLDMNGDLTETKKVKDYLQEIIVSDLQGEVYLLEYAQQKNLKLDEEIIAKIDEQFASSEQTAQSYGMTLDEYLKSMYGPDATADGMRQILQRYEMVNLAMKTYVEEYDFAEGETLLPTVYHILFPTVDLSTGAALTDEQKEEAKKKAEALKSSATSLDDLKAKGDEAIAAGEAAEAKQYTVSLGQMVKPFEEWCFAEHKVGDIDVVETTYGYHVMYFVGKEEADEEQKKQIAYKTLQADMDAAVQSGNYDPTFS